MLVGCVVNDEIADDFDVAPVSLFQQTVEIGQRSELRIDILIVTDVIPEIHLRRRVERRNPDRIDSNLCQIVDL